MGKAPKWWIKKHKGKAKDKADKSKSTNVAKNEEKEENHAFLTSLTINAPEDDTNNNVTLAVMSGHSHKVHAASLSVSIIIDCGASSHFLPLHKKSINYQEINPEPVYTADRYTFSTLGKRDLPIFLCNGSHY